jgi:hypothetical protein
MEKAKHKKGSYCFAAAIQRPNLQAPDSDAVGKIAGLVPGSM